MLNAIQAGIFTTSTKQRLDELEETKSQLEVSILQEEMHKPLLTREQIAFFIYRFRKFDVTKREQRQRLIDSFVNAVYLYEDKIILTFNYKDGSKTITLAEVEGSDLSVLGARRLKSKDLSLFLVSHQQSRDAAAPKGPRVSSGFRQSHLSLHTLPFLPSSRQYTAPTGIRARTSLGGGSWFPLGSQENTLEVRGHLFEQRKLRVVSSDLRP